MSSNSGHPAIRLVWQNDPFAEIDQTHYEVEDIR